MADIPDYEHAYLTFKTMIKHYKEIQERLVEQIKVLASKQTSAAPGQFLLLQFQMSQVTQVGESISNMVAQVNSMINSTIRNQKPQ